jgi:hypothetical protein
MLNDHLTAVARSTIALPARVASSWLSLISTLITCMGRFSSPPLANKSVDRDWRAVDGFIIDHEKRREATFADSVKTTFFASDDNIGNMFLILPSLWSPFHLSIAIQHLEQPITSIAIRAIILGNGTHESQKKNYVIQFHVFVLQLLIHIFVRMTELIHIRLVGRWAR